MSDKVQTAIKWLQWIAQAIGVILAILGGSQAADIAPAAFGGGNETAASVNTLAGMALAFLAPLIAKGVSLFWAWKRGKGETPVVDYLAALGMVASLREYLVSVPAATAPLDTVKGLVVKLESDRVDPPVVVVETK